MLETELKLTVPARALTRLRRHPLLRGMAQTRQVHTVYYDTPDLELWRKGVAFRVRREGRKWVQSVKGAVALPVCELPAPGRSGSETIANGPQTQPAGGIPHSGLHQRVELEVALADSTPDFSQLDTVAQGLLMLRASALPLLPVFSTSFQRAYKKVVYNQILTIMTSLDVGTIDCAGRSEPLCELELELNSGPTQALFDFALELLDDLPLAIENRSKAERGYALYRNAQPEPVKAQTPALDPDISAIDAFKTAAGALLAQAQANRDGVIAGSDPEYLHQMRVAVRRLRALCSLYRKLLGRAALAPLAEELRWLARGLGPARDADVFAIEIWPPLRAALPAHRLLTLLDRQWLAARRAAAADARRALTSGRYQRLMLRFGRWLAGDALTETASAAALEVSARDIARRMIARRDARVRCHGRTLSGLSEARLHALRIRIKKLRYAADTFSTLFGQDAAHKFLQSLSRLQDVLGAINDIHVAEQKVAAGLTGLHSPAVVQIREALTAWRTLHTAALRRKLEAAWRAYLRAEAFW